ncbi:hypothetical protein I79_025746 [Cricetulus griseus]|uniref:Uncharacterized protein n=1 Tax=Cricetulus griseus TaxID=10029 RepID=G3IP43_CRIGR|nr:hypothetical protein I79_025746 [Cricetulus griseus]
MTQSIATTLGGPMGHNNQLANQHRANTPKLEAHLCLPLDTPLTLPYKISWEALGHVFAMVGW